MSDDCEEQDGEKAKGRCEGGERRTLGSDDGQSAGMKRATSASHDGVGFGGTWLKLGGESGQSLSSMPSAGLLALTFLGRGRACVNRSSG